jgi:hypothetical protein
MVLKFGQDEFGSKESLREHAWSGKGTKRGLSVQPVDIKCEVCHVVPNDVNGRGSLCRGTPSKCSVLWLFHRPLCSINQSHNSSPAAKGPTGCIAVLLPVSVYQIVDTIFPRLPEPLGLDPCAAWSPDCSV